MLFNSIQFLIFFPIITSFYFILPPKHKWLLLLIASCVFYMTFIPIYILILFVMILIDYFAGIYIEKTAEENRKGFFLIISIISTCLVLFVFKYYNFFTNNFISVASLLHLNYPFKILSIILPIGLSFHTFQSLSYVIEVYKGRQKAMHHFGIYALYVMFYPQLVAGPIERPQNLLHQFYERHEFVYERVRDGLKLMLWGFFKKMVIADRLLYYVSAVYGNVSQHNGVTLLLATVFFAFQIYCDFSGYSDIAIGSAKVMGFSLMQNFNRPYFAKNIAEFWKRWHISLSTWFRDYLYISLGGNRVSIPRWYVNLFITFLISGLWHGANWTYVVWGALNGLYLICSSATESFRGRITKAIGLTKHPRFHAYIKMIITFCLVCVGWVFFRAASLSDACLILKKIFFEPGPLFLGGFREIMYGVTGIIFLIGFDFWSRGKHVDDFLSQQRLVVRWGVYIFMLLAILTTGVFSYTSQFIYFQF